MRRKISIIAVLIYLPYLIVCAQINSNTTSNIEDKSSWNTDNEFGLVCYKIEKALKNPNTKDEYVYSIFHEVECNDVNWHTDVFDLLMEYNKNELVRRIAFEYLEYQAGNKGFFHYLTDDATKVSSDECKENIFMLRTLWHVDAGMMGGVRDWKILEYIADTYANENKFEKAIKTQKLVLDILRTDDKHPEWESSTTIRAHILNGNYKTDVIDETFSNEIKAYLHMSTFYEKNLDYARQYDFLNKAFELTNSVISYAMKSGNDMHDDKVWHDYKYVYSYIASKYQVADKFKQMGNLLLSSATMRQGFMLNSKNIVRNEVFSTHDTMAIDYYKSVSNSRRAMETDIFKTGKTKGTDMLSYDENLYKLNQIISVQDILKENTSISTEYIKNHLCANEVFVFFYSVGTNNIRVWGEKEEAKNDSVYHALHVNDYYAIVLRKDWTYPEVVYIGNDIGSDKVGTNFTLEQYRVHDNDTDYINKLHDDKIFGHYIWDKIIKVGAIRNRESIVFVPGGVLNQIAIEVLPISEEKRICDLFNVYRLSSSFELSTRCSDYSNKDKITVFGDMNLTGSISSKNNVTSFNRKRLKIRATSNSAFINRERLDTLEGGHKEIQYIRNLFNDKCVVYDGQKGTKEVFFDFNWKSPEYIHVSTHGYNFNAKSMTNEEKNIVYGRLDSIYSNAERSLYETGLFLSKSKNESIDNGIITAKDFCFLNFNKTKLVVLSACSTGRGQWDAEGVHGLVRGFKIAGVKSIIASLWDVHDEATSILIQAFYKYLYNGDDLHTSLYKAQEDVRNFKDESDKNIGSKYIYSAPYYWAGFILVDGL